MPKYLLADNLGSTQVILDAQGGVEQTLAFDPWGMRLNTGDNSRVNSITNRGYTGHEMDDETGLINMNARIYDPYLGRFLSPDPVLPDAYDMQAFNRYSYVLGNPLKYTDPTGNEPVFCPIPSPCDTSGRPDIEEIVVGGDRIDTGPIFSNPAVTPGTSSAADGGLPGSTPTIGSAFGSGGAGLIVDRVLSGERAQVLIDLYSSGRICQYIDCGGAPETTSSGTEAPQSAPVQSAQSAPVQSGNSGQRGGAGLSSNRRSTFFQNPGAYLPSLPTGVVDFGVGLSSAVSFGLGAIISDRVNGSGSFNRDSDAFRYGGYAGIAGGLGAVLRGGLKAAGSTLGGVLSGTGKFFYNPSSFRSIGRSYWTARGGANGASLHHWLIPQRAGWAPVGIRNAGFNLVSLPAFRGVFHRSLGLNQWMGFARNWGGARAAAARFTENAIRVGIPGSIGASAYIGYTIGSED